MKLVSIYTAIIMLLLCTSVIGAIEATDDDKNKMNIGEAMVAGGIDKGIIRLADGMMDFVCGDQSASTTTGNSGPSNPHNLSGNQNTSGSCHGSTPQSGVSLDPNASAEGGGIRNSVTQLIIGFASWSVTPFAYPTIWWMMGISLAGAAGVLIGYTFIGSANAALASASQAKYATLKSVLGSDTGTNTLENYGQNNLTGILGMVLAVFFIYITLLFAKALKLMMMNSIADSISPSLASVSVLYLMMACMWVCVSLFFGISNIVICLTAGASFLIGALYGSDRTRHISVWCADYFFTMVIMQVLVVGIAATVVGIVMDIKTGDYGPLMNPGAESLLYIAMTGIIIYMCYRFVFGKTLILSSGAKIVKMVM